MVLAAIEEGYDVAARKSGQFNETLADSRNPLTPHIDAGGEVDEDNYHVAYGSAVYLIEPDE